MRNVPMPSVQVVSVVDLLHASRISCENVWQTQFIYRAHCACLPMEREVTQLRFFPIFRTVVMGLVICLAQTQPAYPAEIILDDGTVIKYPGIQRQGTFDHPVKWDEILDHESYYFARRAVAAAKKAQKDFKVLPVMIPIVVDGDFPPPVDGKPQLTQLTEDSVIEWLGAFCSKRLGPSVLLEKKWECQNKRLAEYALGLEASYKKLADAKKSGKKYSSGVVSESENSIELPPAKPLKNITKSTDLPPDELRALQDVEAKIASNSNIVSVPTIVGPMPVDINRYLLNATQTQKKYVIEMLVKCGDILEAPRQATLAKRLAIDLKCYNSQIDLAAVIAGKPLPEDSLPSGEKELAEILKNKQSLRGWVLMTKEDEAARKKMIEDQIQAEANTKEAAHQAFTSIQNQYFELSKKLGNPTVEGPGVTNCLTGRDAEDEKCYKNGIARLMAYAEKNTCLFAVDGDSYRPLAPDERIKAKGGLFKGLFGSDDACPKQGN